MKRRLLILTFMLIVGSDGAVAGSLNPQPIAVQEQIAALKKQNQELHEQIIALKQQSWRPSPSSRVDGSDTPQAMLVSNGKDAKASVQTLKLAIEAMNGRL